MTLREKFESGFKNDKLNAKYCEQIANTYAIEFAEWIDSIRLYNTALWQEEDYDKLLEIFKKEKGL
jgi:hypothetical protein